MSDRIDCVVAGHICLDVTPEIPSGGRSISEIFRPGTLVQIGSPTVSTGGPVSNTGLPLRRLGVNVKLMGKCGDDMFGRAIVDCVRREAPGAEAGMIVVPGEQTSYTVVVAPPGIDRIFLHCTGANDTFDSSDIDLDVVRDARLFHFGYPPLMARTYANEGEQLEKIFAEVKDAGATTSLDCAYPDPSGPAGQADWDKIFARTLKHVDIFTPSVEELTLMLEPMEFQRLMAEAGEDEMLKVIDGQLLRKLADRCIRNGAGVVLIKCGYLGSYVRTAGPERLEKFGAAKVGDIENWANRELFEPSYKVDTIVSATGAGDCAIAAFLAAFLRQTSLEDALRSACAVGGQNLSAPDSVSGVRSWEETVAQVADRPEKNDVAIPLEGFAYNEGESHYTGPDDRKG
ncbi:MAG: carbohydrate kinase family protein [Phycisphaerae bacterium]